MRKIRHWTHQETQACIRLQAEGKTCREIGAALGRTENAVKIKIHRIGYGGESKQKRYQLEREMLALSLLQRGIASRAMVKAMGCSKKQAYRYKKRLTPILGRGK